MFDFTVSKKMKPIVSVMAKYGYTIEVLSKDVFRISRLKTTSKLFMFYLIIGFFTVLVSLLLSVNYFVISSLGVVTGFLITFYPFYENKYSKGYSIHFNRKSNEIIKKSFFVKNFKTKIYFNEITQSIINKTIDRGNFSQELALPPTYTCSFYIKTNKKKLILTLSGENENKVNSHIILLAEFLCKNFEIPTYTLQNKLNS